MSLEDSWDIIVLDKLIAVKHSWCDCADRWIRVSQRQIKPRPVWRTKRQLRSECKPDPNALWVQHQSSFGTPSWLACCVSLECWLCKSSEISATCVQDAICNMHTTGRSRGDVTGSGTWDPSAILHLNTTLQNVFSFSPGPPLTLGTAWAEGACTWWSSRHLAWQPLWQRCEQSVE